MLVTILSSISPDDRIPECNTDVGREEVADVGREEVADVGREEVADVGREEVGGIFIRSFLAALHAVLCGSNEATLPAHTRA